MFECHVDPEYKIQDPDAPIKMNKIIYTQTDEAPALATYSLLPIVQRFAKPNGISVVTSDISLSGRVLAQFRDRLTPEQQVEVQDGLGSLGEIVKKPDANVIKLPNISASIPQLVECIVELQEKGFDVPHFPQEPKTEAEKEIKEKYAKVLGSAVNPVLREGNSDRRAAAPIKAYAQKHPHKLLPWDSSSKTHVAHMTSGDFFESEKSHIIRSAGSLKIELVAEDGTVTVLKESVPVEANEVVDTAVMRVKPLQEYVEREMQDCKEKDLMVSLHLKATMMKVSDPIIFGHCVRVFFKDVFAKHDALLKELGVNPNNGFGDLLEKIKGHAKEKEILVDIDAQYASRPRLAMVDSDNGITNLHVPSDIIIDASMPVVVRDSGKMWNKDNKLEDVKCLIPDRCYATSYQRVLEDCKKNGQFDVTTMGHTPNVGLMAKKAEEYGSHPTTFEISQPGTVKVTKVDSNEPAVIMEQTVAQGDIFRMCTVKDAPIQDWVKLAVRRARATNTKAIFWLDPARAHDKNILERVERSFLDHNIDKSTLDIAFMPPQDAMTESCTRARQGLDTISVTGNVLRDYLTDLFPILELGTSAKVMSIVPLLAGGVLLETGAGGSAPKHVQQFEKENHLRWDSLGEYQAIAMAFQEMGARSADPKSALLGDTLMEAIGVFLDCKKSPGRVVKQLDNRGSNFYVALYWADALQGKDSQFAALHKGLLEGEKQIIEELTNCQGPPQDMGGYYRPDPVKVIAAMRPSALFNKLIDEY
eukprot:GEMP01010961.1.p1 GENE.GEMP01010961.1~~GEMP01010961.1.p1  ORF type:complete len:758 (+),score=241.23 GEMP01010961.1:62-2335(+)